MAEYLHGAYSVIQTTGARVADNTGGAFVYVGTAPVHTVEGGAANVNVPIAVNNVAEARKYFGYSDDWAKYTLCEAIYAHLQVRGVGPLVLINVLDPNKAAHKAASETTQSLTPVNGRAVIASAEDIILDTLKVKVGSGAEMQELVKGTDYEAAYSIEKQTITITELVTGALTAAFSVGYYKINAAGVTTADVIGTTDGLGLNTGLYAIQNVYQLTGYVPAYIAAPGFSSVTAIHNAMYQNSQKVNGHWDTYMWVDLPLMNASTQLTLDTVAAYKEAQGYTHENETVFWPLAKGVDGKIYHLSVLAAANFQVLLFDQGGIPYKTASNTEVGEIENLYTGESDTGRVYGDDIINQKLNKNGIASAAYVGGKWVIWGCHSADYNQTNKDNINVSETNRLMLYYISNDFQHRRGVNVDKPLSRNDLLMIIAEEQTRLDALLSIGALTYGVVTLNATQQAKSDIMDGDYSFVFDVTTTPLAKSLTAIVSWTDAGFVTYFENVV